MTSTEAPPEPEIPERAGLSGGLLSAIFIVVVVVGIAVAWLLQSETSDVAEVGKLAPPFTLVAFDGTTFDLDEHLEGDDRPVLLNLWASWCTPCREEFPELSEFQAARPDVMVVGAAVQDQEENAREFAEEMDPVFMVGFDADNSIRDAYQTFALPATFVIDPSGRVLEILEAQLTDEMLAGIDFGVGA